MYLKEQSEYGAQPKELGTYQVECKEMMFYQYLPIKLVGTHTITIEERLFPLKSLIGICCCDFIGEFGLDNYVNSYVYLTAKRLYQTPYCTFNRKGYHSDGFMTKDINYIWSDHSPTVFNFSKFTLTQDDQLSLKEMEQQALTENEHTYPEGSLLRLDQYVIHKVNDNVEGFRTFVKISFSEERYDLIGNSKNYLLDYDWKLRERNIERNIPQDLKI